MEENYIGYLLGALDDDEHQQVEQYIAAHPEANTELDRLRHALFPLESDKDVYDPPVELAMRTVACVAEHIANTEVRIVDPAPSPVAEFIRSLSQSTRRTDTPVYPWHDADESESRPTRRRNVIASFGLAASVFLVIGTGLLTVRQTYEVQSCQNNMRQLHDGLETYCDFHNDRYPQVAANEDVRSTLSTLQKNCSVAPHTLACPGVMHQNNGLPAIDYAYHLGYRDDRGELNGISRADQDRDAFPIVADAPLRHNGGAVPVNHRKGQNVLFAGGNVRFCTNSFVGPDNGGKRDDIFYNADHEPHAGKHRWDTVLGCVNDQP